VEGWHFDEMDNRPHSFRSRHVLMAGIAIVAWLAPAELSANPLGPNSPTMTTATGNLEVTMNPQGDEAFAAGRMTIEKRYTGDLTGNGTGQMLSARTAVPGSAGYVAIEHVSGTLEGQTGSFVLQHSGVMNRGAPSLSVTIVPDSGTGDLEGISGEMKIAQTPDGHTYELVYSFVSGPEE
jgi:hypothetical protein